MNNTVKSNKTDAPLEIIQTDIKTEQSGRQDGEQPERRGPVPGDAGIVSDQEAAVSGNHAGTEAAESGGSSAEEVPESDAQNVPENDAEKMPENDAEEVPESDAEAEAGDTSDGMRRKRKSKDRKKQEEDDDTETSGPVRRKWYVRLLLCFVSFLIVFGIINLVYYMLGMEPFGSKTVAVDDAKIQYIDFFTYYVDVLHGVRPLTYDFSNMLGGSSVGMFSYYLASPFNLLLYFFGKEGVYRFFNIAAALKLATAGATFSWYLQRRFANRIRPVFVVALSMGYGLMQYQVAQSSNIMWLDGVYMLPLIMLGVYEVLHRKTVWRLVLAVTFCIFCNWYIAGINCLFSGIWFLFEFFFRDEVIPARRRSKTVRAVPDRRYSGSRSRTSLPQLGITEFVVSACRYGWAMGLGVAMSSIMFLPAISAMRQGKGQFNDLEIEPGFAGDLLSFLRGYMIGNTGKTTEPGYAALFCGGLAILGACALIFSGSCKIRQKIAYLALLGICFVMLYWKPATLVFSLMKRADSYWYRYSYLVCFVLLFGAGAYLSRAGKDRWSKIFVILLALLYAAGLMKLNGIHPADLAQQGPALIREHKVLFATAAASIILAVLTVLLLSLGKKTKGQASGLRRGVQAAAGLLLLAVTGAELWANAWMFWRSNSENTQAFYMEYSEGVQNQLAQLRAVDGGYYRIAQDRTRWHYEKDDLTAYLNDSLAQNYWSNTAYTSSPDNTQLSLMWRLGYRDEAGCMMIVRDPVIPSDSFLGVKYYLQSTPIQGLEPVEGVEDFNGRKAYRNPYALPMAFTYDGSQIPTMRYDNQTFIYQNALFSTLSGKRTEIYTPLSWTREKIDKLTYFSVFVPKGNYLIYGNLPWPEKMDGLMSINGADAFGYCRWTSPESFMIRSRTEQAQSTASESLQAIDRAEAEAAEQSAGGAASADEDTAHSGAGTQNELESRKAELEEKAAAYDRTALESLNTESYADVRTVVFSQTKNCTFRNYQFYGLDLDALQAAVERIRTGAVDENNLTIENGHVTCSVDGRVGQSLCLLVPWSKGWKAFRNGEQVQPDTVAGTMITIPLLNGQNEIELTYEVPYLREGMYVSAAVFGVLLIDILCRLLSNRKKRR